MQTKMCNGTWLLAGTVHRPALSVPLPHKKEETVSPAKPFCDYCNDCAHLATKSYAASQGTLVQPRGPTADKL